MKNLLLFVALAGLLVGVHPAHAGTAKTGHHSTGTYHKLSKQERRLVGTWRMVAFEISGRRQPLPTNIKYLVHIRADGLAVVSIPQAKPTTQKATWKVKGKQIVLTFKKKTMKVRYRFVGKDLAVVPPGRSKFWIILTRASKRP